jgi:coenzyme F420-dependent glucose-6-phosphate dehydrogenase
MPEFGYALSSEEHRPNDLVRYAQRAELSGFRFALISDHFHPWIDKQGQSPFVWSVIGAIAATTKTLRLGTGVTCPTIRIHPAIIAQAAATAAAMMPNRFFLGVGAGENLNEHILGDKWPRPDIRREMLDEAVQVIRHLWKGGTRNHRGHYYEVENARIFTLPDTLPSIMVAAGGDKAAELAGRIGDGLICAGGDKKLIKKFAESGGKGKPLFNQITVCWARNEKEATKTAHGIWPISGLEWPLLSDLSLPAHFEAAAGLVTEEVIAKHIICGPDRERYISKIEETIEAGFDHIYFHQAGPDQEGFFQFFEREILPKFGHGPQSKKSFAGKGHKMKVSEIMTPDVEVIAPDVTVKDAAQRMKQLDIGFIPVCENDQMIGALTDRDITVRVVAEGRDITNTKVRDVMTKEVFFCFVDQDLDEATRVMQDNQVRRIIVLDRNRRVAGVISLGDLALSGEEGEAAETLRETSEPAA